MSPHYSTVSPRARRLLWFIGNVAFPLFIMAFIVNAMLDSNRQMLWFAGMLANFYVVIRIAGRVSRRYSGIIYFGVAAVEILLFSVFLQLTAKDLEHQVTAIVMALLGMFCGLFARVEYLALPKPTPAPSAPNPLRNADYPGIYCVTCIPNGMQYIGQTSRPINERWNDHRSSLNAGRHHNDRWQHDWGIYRPEQFKWEVLEVVTDQAWLLDRERYWQNLNYETGKRYNPPNTPRVVNIHGKRPRK